MAFAERILDQHDSSKLAMPRFAVAGFKLHTSGQPYDELADGGRVPVGDLQSGRHPPKPHRGRRFPSRHNINVWQRDAFAESRLQCHSCRLGWPMGTKPQKQAPADSHHRMLVLSNRSLIQSTIFEFISNR
jgi:hypothetical protein